MASDIDDEDTASEPMSNWKPITPADLYTYLAIFFVMGLAPLPRLCDYWNTTASHDSMVQNRWIAAHMGRDRWLQIHAALAYTFTTFMDGVNRTAQYFYTPASHVSVDETLILFKGRYLRRQHIRGKPKATGLKLYALADSEGYVWAFEIYTGTKKTTVEIVEEFAVRLDSAHPDKDWIFFVDSYYGSWQLAQVLMDMGVYFVMLCSTARPSWLFKDWLVKGAQQGVTRFVTWNEECSAICQKDRKPVCILTNAYRSDCARYASKQNPAKSRWMSAANHAYNQYMHGVDLADAYLQRFMPRHKNRSWKKPLFWGLSRKLQITPILYGTS